LSDHSVLTHFLHWPRRYGSFSAVRTVQDASAGEKRKRADTDIGSSAGDSALSPNRIKLIQSVKRLTPQQSASALLLMESVQSAETFASLSTLAIDESAESANIAFSRYDHVKASTIAVYELITLTCTDIVALHWQAFQSAAIYVATKRRRDEYASSGSATPMEE
jgi:hypothetical protein